MVIGKLLRRNSILGEREAELRARERELLDRLGTAFDRFGADVDPDDLRHFNQAREQLGGLFLLVIAGEFNAASPASSTRCWASGCCPRGSRPPPTASTCSSGAKR